MSNRFFNKLNKVFVLNYTGYFVLFLYVKIKDDRSPLPLLEPSTCKVNIYENEKIDSGFSRSIVTERLDHFKDVIFSLYLGTPMIDPIKRMPY